MANVTYLLGAGASCEALPTYQNFHGRFENYAKCFTLGRVYNELNPEERERSRYYNSVLTAWLNEFKFHPTPDTIAKKLFHKDSEKKQLIEFKFILILFFYFEQLVQYGKLFYGDNGIEKMSFFDKRYDAFIASILKPKAGSIEIFNEFNILTWNYDLQAELGFKNYFGLSIENTQDKINSYPRIINKESSISEYSKDDIAGFSIVHLNGIAYPNYLLTESESESLYSPNQTNDLTQVVRKTLDLYYRFQNISDKEKEEVVSNMRFAWERMDEYFNVESQPGDYFKNALSIAEKTDILVIIGYSFPVFNDPIDSLLLNAMPLKEIHIQSPDSKSIVKKLESNLFRRKVKPFELDYWNSFAIPSTWKSHRDQIGFVVFEP